MGEESAQEKTAQEKTEREKTARAGPSPGADVPNRRKSPRYSLSVPGSAWCLTRVSAGPLSITTSNISLSGLMIHASADPAELLREGDELVLGFPHAGSKAQVMLKVRIVWRRQGLANLLGSWAFGVVFFDTPDEEVRKLHDPAAKEGEPLAGP